MRNLVIQGKKVGGRRPAWAGPAIACICALFATAAQAAPPQVVKVAVIELSGTAATLTAEVNPGGKETRWHFEYGTANCAMSPCTSIPLPEGKITIGSSPVLVEAKLQALTPGTIYHFLLSAKNGEGGTIKSSDHIFATAGTPSAGLPDNRAYEQASPVDKDGGDAIGKVGLVKAAADGEGITFNSTFGIPGAKGAGVLPTYLAQRGPGETGWWTQGLLAPPQVGERTPVLGWLPDFSETFLNAEKLGNPRTKALISQSTTGGPTTTISPYTPEAQYAFVGTDQDNSIVFFESRAKLPPEEGKPPIAAAIEGKSNVYAWERASGRISLVSVFNNGASPSQGAFSGTYDWSAGTSANSLRLGGAARNYYLQDTHAISALGDIYFTEAGTGQLYLRLNPIQPQSAIVAGECTEGMKACTVHVSASRRVLPDPAGPQPAIFQAAVADGSEAFFTSPEKLTEDANTGPEQPGATISRDTNDGSPSNIELKFIPKHAVGVTVDGAHVYWADPVAGTIGRADLDGNESSVEEAFIEPGETECEEEVETEPGVFVKEKVLAPSAPRYVAVDSKYIYWTNTGIQDSEGDPKDGGGTIGRAELDGNEASIDPEFICGASNPQGIAVNATHIYWANAAKDGNKHAIGRATIGGGEANQEFVLLSSGRAPYGVVLDANHVYFSLNTGNGFESFVGRIPLAGGSQELIGIGKAGLRGVALNGTYLYWVFQSENTIGRIPLADFPTVGACVFIATCENDFIEKIEGSLDGLAADASHLYWTINGEAPTNPGNDLYRYEPGTDELEDLTPLPTGNGAEVKGLLGASVDGSYLYFAANGDLDGAGDATLGDCRTPRPGDLLSMMSGSCNLYLLHEGKASFVARLRGRDSLNWTGSTSGIFASGGTVPKSSFLGDGGRVILFRSREKLTEYDNEGVSELYRYSADDETLRCVSCPPNGDAPEANPGLASIQFPGSISPPASPVAVTESHNLSADGNRVFFETAEALLEEDTNGQANCPGEGPYAIPACQDVYEWEAPGSGSCSQGGPGYSVLNEGCIYLISTGKSPFPSYFADASETGDDVFFFTREGLVGQDQDELQDVYDARVGGGLASQNPAPPNPCPSAEACHGPAQTPPTEPSPGSASFLGPGDQKAKHLKAACPKGKVRRGGKCVKKPGKAQPHKKHRRANYRERTSR